MFPKQECLKKKKKKGYIWHRKKSPQSHLGRDKKEKTSTRKWEIDNSKLIALKINWGPSLVAIAPTQPHSWKHSLVFRAVATKGCLSTSGLECDCSSPRPHSYLFLFKHQRRTPKSRVGRETATAEQHKGYNVGCVKLPQLPGWGLALPRYFRKVRKPLVSSAPIETLYRYSESSAI